MSGEHDFKTGDDFLKKIDQSQDMLGGHPVFAEAGSIQNEIQRARYSNPDEIRHMFQPRIDKLNEGAFESKLLDQVVILSGEVYIPEIMEDDDGLRSISHIRSVSDRVWEEPCERGGFAGFSIRAIPVEYIDDDGEECVEYSATVCVRVAGEFIVDSGFEAEYFSFGDINKVSVEFVEESRKQKIEEAINQLIEIEDKKVAENIDSMEQLFEKLYDEDNECDLDKLKLIGQLSKDVLNSEPFDGAKMRSALVDLIEAQVDLAGCYVELISPAVIMVRPPARGEGVKYVSFDNQSRSVTSVEGEVLGMALLPQLEQSGVVNDREAVIPYISLSNTTSSGKEQIVYVPLDSVAGLDIQIEA